MLQMRQRAILMLAGFDYRPRARCQMLAERGHYYRRLRADFDCAGLPRFSTALGRAAMTYSPLPPFSARAPGQQRHITPPVIGEHRDRNAKVA